MPNAITLTMQSLFFPGLKVPVKPEWRQKLQRNHIKKTDFTIPRAGGELAITLLEPETISQNKIVILAHPVSRKARHFFGDYEVIDFYLQNKFRVVLFDFNGFGESSRIDMYYWKDAEEVIRWVLAQGYAEEIVLHGTSFGAFHTVRAARALPKGSTLLLENVSRSLYDYWKRWKLTGFAARYLPKLPYKAFRDMEIRTVLASELDHIRVVLFACRSDRFTPAAEMRDLASARKTHTAFIEFECGHLEAYKHFPEDYWRELQNHLELK